MEEKSAATVEKYLRDARAFFRFAARRHRPRAGASRGLSLRASAWEELRVEKAKGRLAEAASGAKSKLASGGNTVRG